MVPNRQPWTDEAVEQVVGNLLRAGVLLAAAVVLAGGLWYLIEHGHESPNYQQFAPEQKPGELRTLSGTAAAVRALHSRGLLQLGLLLLIATPIARVIFSVYAFAREHDWTYVVVTLLVLAVLLYSLIWGKF